MLVEQHPAYGDPQDHGGGSRWVHVRVSELKAFPNDDRNPPSERRNQEKCKAHTHSDPTGAGVGAIDGGD